MKKFLYIGTITISSLVTSLVMDANNDYKPNVISVPVIPVSVLELPDVISETPDPVNLPEVTQEDIESLALNIYHESRGQSLRGQLAVAFVTLNRVISEKFPDNIHDVVFQTKYPGKLNKCQFSWTCDGISDNPKNDKAWDVSLWVAKTALTIYNDKKDDITSGATYYHADYVKPYWSDIFGETVKIGNHIFYTDEQNG